MSGSKEYLRKEEAGIQPVHYDSENVHESL